MNGIHCMLITSNLTYVDAMQPRTTPPVTDLTELLSRTLVAFLSNRTGGGVVLLDSVMAGKLGLPVGELPSGDAAKNHPAAAGVRRAGWTCKEIHRWSRFAKGDTTIHVGLLEFIDQCPLVSEHWPQDTAAAFAGWHVLTGSPFAGNAGDTFNALIRKHGCKPRIEVRGKKTTVTPVWWGKNGPLDEPVEATFRRTDWEFDQPGRYLHGYDLVRAYLAAMAVVEVPVLDLIRGPREFDPKFGGWWKVELAPWNVDYMPDPAGYSYDWEPVRWLTTPTLQLIQERVEEGIHGGFQVVESWVSQTSRAVLRPAAEILRDTYAAAGKLDNEQDREALQAAVKDAYRRCHGMWRSRQSDIQRPDWAHSVAAMCRANLWRKCWKAGKANGRWPVFLNGIDTAWYASDNADPWVDAPAGFRNEDALGGFTAKGFVDRETLS